MLLFRLYESEGYHAYCKPSSPKKVKSFCLFFKCMCPTFILHSTVSGLTHALATPLVELNMRSAKIPLLLQAFS